MLWIWYFCNIVGSASYLLAYRLGYRRGGHIGADFVLPFGSAWLTTSESAISDSGIAAFGFGCDGLRRFIF
ncbi:MAG: hypothetical protein A2214_00465 [Candidatus Harrisonbacteria bacterium RIFOXYA1_FULL_48_8]|uniref:Uncharacterized protein n=2 Tax=Candidatus Harrisoniibacteriota TaxID=1817905 RepID=A0A1G1ZW80_9BACT|nr:MAG: hypothetical protein A3E64_01490 [Candidatus Harrisonbacteria bacterium RIFCSPHIGHO2_12_FULL_48_16]OGY68396.1 MAG: hypothetical protein A2214_00465 [Candidatus Harrisonbacteria bacterium RIFOXYA1_FULL_48_8]